jgi:phosphoglucosamine mutase
MSHVLETGSDIGLAFDGDADRLILVDEHGQIVDGDHIMAICGIGMKTRGTLYKDTVVATVMSNLGLDLALKKAGCKIVKTKVGDRYVLEEMLAQGYNFGGEQSGHLIFLDYNTTGDGILTALQVMSIMKGSDKSLSKLTSVMTKFPQVLANARVNDDKKATLSDDTVIQQEIKNIESKFMENGRVIIRASGTEPLIRVMIEGQDQPMIERYAYQLARLIEQRLG